MTTSRKYLTRRETALMFQEQGGKCACGCGRKLDADNFIREHTIPNFYKPGKPDALWHKVCADKKTNGTKATTYGSDKHEISKTKRLSPDHKETTQYERRQARGGSMIRHQNTFEYLRRLRAKEKEFTG